MPPTGERLRAWDRMDQDLVERVVDGERTPCITLGLHLVVARIPDGLACIRLARDPEGTRLVLLNAEQREVADTAREAEARARASAEARVRELEAKLASNSRRT